MRPLSLSIRAAGATAAALLLALAAALPLAAQESVTVSGRVVDARTGQPLPGARVEVVGAAQLRSFADAEGRFRLRVSPGPRVFHAVLLGYGARTVQATVTADTALADVRLDPDPVMLEALVAVGDRHDRAVRSNGQGTVDVLTYAELRRAAAGDAQQLVLSRLGIARVPCPGDRGLVGTSGGRTCLLYRGRTVGMTISIDGVRATLGAEDLARLNPSEIWRVYSFNRGMFVSVFTTRWAERQANAAYAARRRAAAEEAAARTGAPATIPTRP